jgi:hypothetical protein
MSPRLDRCRLIELPRIPDPRGTLTFIEGGRHIPFSMKRTYWIYDVPGGEVRGGHAYRALEEFVIALSGSFDVELDDGISRRTVSLNRSYYGLYVAPLIWRQIKNFSTNSVCLIAASDVYCETDYLRNYPEFLAAAAADS